MKPKYLKLLENIGTELVMPFGWIDSKDATKIANLLLTNTSLTTLDLSYNELGDKGVATLTNALLKNTTLKKLILVDNGITTEGVKAILSANTNLTSIDIRNNSIRDFSDVTLNTKLEELFITAWNKNINFGRTSGYRKDDFRNGPQTFSTRAEKLFSGAHLGWGIHVKPFLNHESNIALSATSTSCTKTSYVSVPNLKIFISSPYFAPFCMTFPN